MTKFEKALLNWLTLNEKIMNFNKKDSEKLLAMEKDGRNRSTFITRIQKRIIGASNEELNKGFNNEDDSKSN